MAIIVAISLVAGGCGSVFYMGQQPSTGYRTGTSHMAEELRSSVRTVAVKPSSSRPILSVGGDYGRAVPTASEGASAGAEAGASASGEIIGENPAAILLLPILLPVAMIAGSIMGAAAAKIQQQVQEFRDQLTEDLTQENNATLPSDALAREVYVRLESVSDIEPTLTTAEASIPADIDATLDVVVEQLTVMVEGNDAIMTAAASAKLTRTEDNSMIYSKGYNYSVKDTLNNWTRDDNALWSDYIDNAQQYIARKISDDFFEKVELRHVLRPLASASVSDITRSDWTGSAISPTPTLAWELILLGGDTYGGWTDQIHESAVAFDLEIYDDDQLVYFSYNIPEPRHAVQEALPECKSLSWSVRPVYHIDGKTRAGEWMNRSSAGERTRNQYGLLTGRFERKENTESRRLREGYPQITTRCH
ncbi:MAG: hypothetical protein ACI88G_002225 [Woeseiaceae bacterium]